MQLNGFRACDRDVCDVMPLFFLYYFLAKFEKKRFLMFRDADCY